MPQDRKTGAAAHFFGKRNARRVAKLIGAQLLSTKASNEAVFRGGQTVLKSAKRGNTRIGVTYVMLRRLDSIIGVFQEEDGQWLIVELAAKTYRRHATRSKGQGASAGKLGMVTKGLFLSKGNRLGGFRLQASL